MVGTEIIVMLNKNGKLVLNDYYSQAYIQPSNKLSNALTFISSSANATGIFGIFTRPLKNLDSNSQKITEGLATDFSFAYLQPSGEGFSYHSHREIGAIVFGTTNSTSSFISGGNTTFEAIDFNYYTHHGEYMTTMWVCIIQVAIMIMRYFKWWSFSGIAHSLLGTFAMIFTLVSAYQTYKKDKISLNGLHTDSDLLHHSRLAFTISSLSLSQCLLGILTKFVLVGKENIKLGSISRKVHQILGWSIPMMALVNIKYGWTIRDKDKLNAYVYPCYGVLVFLLILLEIRHRWGHRVNAFIVKYRRHKFESIHATSQQEGIALFLIEGVEKRHVEILKEIIEKKREWVFYDEYILDVSGFKWNHPGGSFVFPLIYGQDAGKFINGCSSINDNTRPYTHSAIAKNMINFLKIGRVAYPVGVLVASNSTETQSDMNWTITDNTMLSTVTNCLEFSSNNWEVSSDPPGYEWMGKHFLVTLQIQGRQISRYYSLVIVNLSIWAESARKLGYACKDYRMKKNPGKIRLHIKEYPGGKMSGNLCRLDIGSVVNFKGPIGPGLCIQGILDKDYLIFGAGTGILPFLDLIYNVWLERLKNCRLHVYISFRKEEEGFALDVLQATTKRFPDVVKLYIRNGPAGFELDGEFWRNTLPLQEAELAWICGPPIFNRKVKRILTDEGMSLTKIILL